MVARFSGVARQSELIVVSLELEKFEPSNIYGLTRGRMSGLPREIGNLVRTIGSLQRGRAMEVVAILCLRALPSRIIW